MSLVETASLADPVMTPVTVNSMGKVTDINGQSTVESKTYKLYMISPGDGTVGLSWLIFGIALGSLLLLGTFIAASVCLCCGDKLRCCTGSGGSDSAKSGGSKVNDTSKYQF